MVFVSRNVKHEYGLTRLGKKPAPESFFSLVLSTIRSGSVLPTLIYFHELKFTITRSTIGVGFLQNEENLNFQISRKRSNGCRVRCCATFHHLNPPDRFHPTTPPALFCKQGRIWAPCRTKTFRILPALDTIRIVPLHWIRTEALAHILPPRFGITCRTKKFDRVVSPHLIRSWFCWINVVICTIRDSESITPRTMRDSETSWDNFSHRIWDRVGG